MVMNTPDIMSSDWLAGLFRSGDWASEAQGFEAGVSLRTGLTAEVTVRFASEEAAKRLVTEITQLTNGLEGQEVRGAIAGHREETKVQLRRFDGQDQPAPHSEGAGKERASFRGGGQGLLERRSRR